MAVVLKGRNHLSFKPMQQLYNLINEKVEDINSIRKAKATARERQWIYPSMPLANDENYPRVALLNDGVRFEEYGSGRFLGYEKNLGVVEKVVFAKIAVIPITIGVFVKRRQRWQVDYYDGTTHIIQNMKQADFLGDKIAKFIEFYREDYFIPYNMDIKITNISRSYNDNDFLIAKNIDAEILCFDEWEIDLNDPASTVKAISNIDLNITII